MANTSLLDNLQLFFDTSARLLVCTRESCKFALSNGPSRVTTHLRDKHNISAEARKGPSQLPKSLSPAPLEPNDASPRADGSTKHDKLRVYKGFACINCQFRTINIQSTRRHQSSPPDDCCDSGARSGRSRRRRDLDQQFELALQKSGNMSQTRPPAGVVPKEGLPDKITLPNELYLRILGFLETNDLLRLEGVSTHFRGLVMDSYKTVYGSGPCHRVAKLPSDYRRLAIEQLQYKEDVEFVRDWEPSTFTCRLFDDVYFHTDEDIHEEATEILLFLQGSTSYGCAEWSEAVAVALIAQARYTEAAKHFAKSNMEVEKLHENRFLAAARFGWSPELGEKPQISTKSCMDKAFVGMACHGDLESMTQLNEKGVRLDITVGYNITAARMAKIHGHDHILKFLHEHGVGLLS